MFNWPLFTILVLVCIPGLVVTITSNMNLIEAAARSQAKGGRKPPPRQVLAFASFAQSLVLVMIAAAAGVALAPSVGLSAPFFEALVTPGVSAWAALQPQLLPALVVGVAGGLVFVAAYYLLFRPRFDEPTLVAIEGLRMNMGMQTRILYGGIVEEVLTRWGLMTLFVWLGSLVFGQSSDLVMWLAIVISGILFGLGHVPGMVAAGARKSPVFYTAEISLNLWAAILFGWLFWHYGLAAAMIAHTLFHVVWFPFDRRYGVVE